MLQILLTLNIKILDIKEAWVDILISKEIEYGDSYNILNVFTARKLLKYVNTHD